MNPTVRHLLRAWVLPFADPRPLASLARLPRFFGEWRRYRAASRESDVRAANLWPCLTDWTARTPFDPHYFHQAAWLGRRLAAAAPALHVDVGSSVTMIGVTSAIVPTVFLDYRPIASTHADLLTVAGTLTALPFADASLASVSSLHVIEHVGLGRYGDPLDPRGSERALAELGRVVAPGGKLYVSMPVGRARVHFNAHRVLDARSVAALAGLALTEFALVDDAGAFRANADPADASALDYGCGMFELERRSAR